MTSCIAAFDLTVVEQYGGMGCEALDEKSESNCLTFDFELPMLPNANFLCRGNCSWS